MKTASWFTKLPDDHCRIGISRGTPRGQPGGFRLFKRLAPGPWFNSAGPDEYYDLYQREILAPLDPVRVAAQLQELAGDRMPVLLCFEPADGRAWCHRAMAAEWLAAAIGCTVPEFGFEALPQDQHPLMPAALR